MRLDILTGMSDVHRLVLVTVLGVNDSQFLYPSCEKCFTKQTKDRDSRWLCVKCGAECAEKKLLWRFRLSLRVSDASAVCNVCIFGGSLDQFFGDRVDKFHRNIIKLAKDHSNAEEIVLSAVQEIFVGNSFYLGLKATANSRDTPVTLLDILKYSDHDIPTSTQEQENLGTSLIANQIISVEGKSKSDVSSIIRGVLKYKDSNMKNCSSLKKSTQKYYPLLPKKFSQEETLELSMFSQPSVCLSCDSTDHQSCENSKFLSGGSNFCHGKSVPHHSVIDTVIPKSSDNCDSVHLSKKKTAPNLTFGHFEQEAGPLDNSPLHSSKKENFTVSRGREEYGACMCSNSMVNTSLDLFDSPQPLKQKSPNSPYTYPCEKYSKIDTDNLDHVFPLEVNNFQKNVQLCPKYEDQSCSSFSKEVFTPSPRHKMTCTSANKHRGSHNVKKRSSSKYLSLLRKRPKGIPSQFKVKDAASDVQVPTENVRETESPLLFSDTSCDFSVTSPNWDWEDNSISSSFTSPDIFASTPSQSSTNKTIIPPYLVKQICKD